MLLFLGFNTSARYATIIGEKKLYLPEKDPGALLNPKLKENKKMYPQEISYIFCL